MYTNNPMVVVNKKKLKDMLSIKKFKFTLILKFIKIHLKSIILKTFCSKKIFFKKNKEETQRENKLIKFKKKTPYKPKKDINIKENKTVENKKIKKIKKNGTSVFINVIIIVY